MHSFSHWAIMTRATGKTDSEVHSFSHWASMTRATERTDSEIHSFSNRAIMTGPWRGQTVRYIHFPTELSWPAMERTDSDIHSFSHWVIMTRVTERTCRQWNTLIFRWAIMTRAMERRDSEIHSFFRWASITNESPESLIQSLILFIITCTFSAQFSGGSSA